MPGTLYKPLLGTSSENSHSDPVKQSKWVLLSSAPFLHMRKLRLDGLGTEAAPAEKRKRSGTWAVWLSTRKASSPCCLPQASEESEACHPTSPGDEEFTEALDLAGGKVTSGWEVEGQDQSCQVLENISGVG